MAGAYLAMAWGDKDPAAPSSLLYLSEEGIDGSTGSAGGATQFTAVNGATHAAVRPDGRLVQRPRPDSDRVGPICGLLPAQPAGGQTTPQQPVLQSVAAPPPRNGGRNGVPSTEPASAVAAAAALPPAAGAEEPDSDAAARVLVALFGGRGWDGPVPQPVANTQPPAGVVVSQLQGGGHTYSCSACTKVGGPGHA